MYKSCCQGEHVHENVLVTNDATISKASSEKQQGSSCLDLAQAISGLTRGPQVVCSHVHSPTQASRLLAPGCSEPQDSQALCTCRISGSLYWSRVPASGQHEKHVVTDDVVLSKASSESSRVAAALLQLNPNKVPKGPFRWSAAMYTTPHKQAAHCILSKASSESSRVAAALLQLNSNRVPKGPFRWSAATHSV